MRVKSITFQFQKSWQKHKDLRSKFLGVSRAEIRTILNIDKSNHRRNAKFLNKAKLTPIRARDAHVRHQTGQSALGLQQRRKSVYTFERETIEAV